ncbi:ribokinase [Salinibacterium sp. NSLL150]|uniref:ribokinase n=1 Tax=unclassified Salinibacterium TaxID=2632331 RepID=UPI0018CE06FD|nr:MULTISPECIES: ribokinase [unclassified Salinibacterium]MBH0100128.1 ribokinase [Salinibacterium sp. NSLL35]MBH0102882.1 ribokinase [Salinibacterium sp. NSLL150]MBH0105642.1 ribokinase [Salinibacterium sp. NSLL16]MBH0108402.1 ribokinase [Salinibacterium sp. NSLL17]
MSGIVVVGSANIDQVFRVERIPSPGETVMSQGLNTALGGKGQNQAVAAARAGVATTFIGAVGNDGFGEMVRDGLAADSIDVSHLKTTDKPTGTALIAVDPTGENTIIVEAGANNDVANLTSEDSAAISTASALMMQLEIPLATVIESARIAHAVGTQVILNAAPIQPLPKELLDNLDILIVNEHEAAELARDNGLSADLEGVGERLLSLVSTVIVTLGSKGAALHRVGSEPVVVPAHRVTAVDATGAGDTFCGAFAAGVVEGMMMDDALRFAGAAASISVENHGAVPSIPHRAAIETRLN